jgi:Zn-dependent peptidase ImmA (M78 family)
LEQLSKNELESFIEKIAIEQRKLAKIEDIIPDNYYDVIEKIGVNVIARDFHNDHYFGVSSFSNSCGSFILINDSKQISEERKIFSLIHEYAHLLFHSNQYSSIEYNAFYVNNNKDFHEQVANSFAGYFLMPRNLVESYVNSLSSLDVFDMKKHFQVSIQTVFMMLNKYQMISKEVYQKFWAVINSNGWKKHEPDPIESIQPEHKNNRIIRHIKDLYMKDEITSNKISEVLGLDALQIRQLLKDWRSKDERFIPLR